MKAGSRWAQLNPNESYMGLRMNPNESYMGPRNSENILSCFAPALQRREPLNELRSPSKIILILNERSSKKNTEEFLSLLIFFPHFLKPSRFPHSTGLLNYLNDVERRQAETAVRDFNRKENKWYCQRNGAVNQIARLRSVSENMVKSSFYY